MDEELRNLQSLKLDYSGLDEELKFDLVDLGLSGRTKLVSSQDKKITPGTTVSVDLF